MEMLDQPTAPAKETSLGEERWTLECGNVTIVTAPGYEDLESSDNWQVTLPHCPPLCRRMKPCGNIFEAAGPPHCAGPFWSAINKSLLVCSSNFYKACRPGFGRLKRVCNFDPAEAAIEFDEQELVETVMTLKAKVETLTNKK